MQIDLSGGAALITGATQGIGAAVARHFAQQGCALHLWDKQAAICDLAAEISQQYSIPVTGRCVDVASESEVSEAADKIAQTGEASLKYVVHAAA
ncbi:MAG: SDR family NAD(P)-dependent oxidoreductase, partial [Planctomycetota bacterium]|nr:SDR family NAD(P)-dependent oxidoreductase [Planctomycetota bacterium]